ncbi:MAG: hypothetical protein GY822_26815 [Deltaproteobacteria bacterium]|nr:hypothetical protein [Deltaproteobacteria bacterium]
MLLFSEKKAPHKRSSTTWKRAPRGKPPWFSAGFSALCSALLFTACGSRMVNLEVDAGTSGPSSDAGSYATDAGPSAQADAGFVVEDAGSSSSDDAGAASDAGLEPDPEPESMVEIEAAMQATEQGLRVFTLPSTRLVAYSSLAVDVVVQASLLNEGLLTTSGTLISENGMLRYEELPAENLLFQAPDGTVNFRITTLQGDLTAGSDSFFRGPHQLAITARHEDAIDATLVIQAIDGLNATRSISGTLVDEEDSFSVNVSSTGSVLAQVEVNGLAFESTDLYTGSISGPDFSAEYSESVDFTLINVENFVTNRERRITASWTHGENHFVVAEGWIRTSYVNGSPAEFDFWRAEGEVLRNSSPFAALALNETNFAMNIILEFDDEDRVLESHPK